MQTLDQRIHSIGREIFERADAARPRPWQSTWWAERLTRLVDQDDRLKTRAFEFVDCLPTLRTDAEITRHLAEYLDPAHVPLPRLVQAMVGPGWFRSARESLIGRAARIGARQMAGRFITGYDIPSVIKTLERLRRNGMAFTLDVLGESTTSYKRADEYARVYHDLIDRLTSLVNDWSEVPVLDRDDHGPMPRVNLSIKLSGLDPHFDAIDPERSIATASERVRPLFHHARKAGAFINVDIESTKHRRLTIELFKQILMEPEFRDWSDVGIALQAYLTDGEDDLAELLEWGRNRGYPFAIRLVKGAYWDAETAAAVRSHATPPVWTRKWESDACYERMTRTMLDNVDLIRPAFASHNVRSLAVACAAAEAQDISPRRYEIQTLFGMGDQLKTAMVQLGRCVRVYCPYGDLMPGMGYLIRRLLENTSNEGFLKQSFSDRGRRDRLLADPTLIRPPSAPLPQRHYQNTDLEEPLFMFTNAANTNFSVKENRQKMIGAIEYVRKEAGRNYPLLVNGHFVAAKDAFDSHNPSQPAESIGRIAGASTADADRAVAAARKAFRDWAATPAAVRADLLRKTADRMEMRRFELAATMILEVGKPWREADADVTEAVDHCRYYAEQIERIESRPRLRNIPGEDNMLCYAPKGVCAVISPYAFPLAILTGMTTAAIAAGNTVVVKPARQASVTAARLVEILHDAGLPPGVANYLPGDGTLIGPHLVEHGDVNIVAFTGSEAVGTKVIQLGANVRPAQSFIKKMIVEMGGKNAIIVDDDADLDGAVQAVVESAFGYAGQKCSSCSRLIVLGGVYETLCERLRDAVQSVTIGPAESPSTLVGPVIDRDTRRRLEDYIEIGRREGRLLVQSDLPPGLADGFFVPPAVFADVDPDARIAQEEIFGPLLAVLPATGFDHAIQIANGTRYALTGGLFSRSPSHIDQARRDFAVGNLYINRRITGSQVDAQPFGGFKLSGTGVKAGSPDYLLHFMDARCITENTSRSGLVPAEERNPSEPRTSARADPGTTIPG